MSRRTETGQAITCTQVCGAVPMWVLFADLIHKVGGLLQAFFSRFSRNAASKLATPTGPYGAPVSVRSAMLPEFFRTANKTHTHAKNTKKTRETVWGFCCRRRRKKAFPFRRIFGFDPSCRRRRQETCPCLSMRLRMLGDRRVLSHDRLHPDVHIDGGVQLYRHSHSLLA
jgi:hypothetical protein